MMFELSPFGIVVPEWVITVTTLAIWFAVIVVVLRLVMLHDRPFGGRARR